jgi:hypothetical protein
LKVLVITLYSRLGRRLQEFIQVRNIVVLVLVKEVARERLYPRGRGFVLSGMMAVKHHARW